jgi:hypothetical protein
MKQSASIKTIIDTIFDALGDAGEREGNRFYVERPYTIDVQDVAVALLEQFDITEPQGATDGN